jgi:hypothetical protein
MMRRGDVNIPCGVNSFRIPLDPSRFQLVRFDPAGSLESALEHDGASQAASSNSHFGSRANARGRQLPACRMCADFVPLLHCVGALRHGQGRVAMTGYRSACWKPGELHVYREGCVAFVWLDPADHSRAEHVIVYAPIAPPQVFGPRDNAGCS